MTMRVLLVEDDDLQSQQIAEALRDSFGDVVVRTVGSEGEFVAQLRSIVDEPPDLILMDVMLRWAEPAPDMPPPPAEVNADGFYRAGIRCVRRLMGHEATREVPVVLYTVLGRQKLEEEIRELPDHVLFLEKDSEDDRLVRYVRSLLSARSEILKDAETWQGRLRESVEAKPGWLGFSVDLKRLLRRKRRDRSR